MLLRQITEATMVWTKSGGKTVRKYRCTNGYRAGRVMASPASCNKPLNVHKSAALKKTKAAKSARIAMTGVKTRRSNPQSQQLRRLNKPKHRRRKIK